MAEIRTIKANSFFYEDGKRFATVGELELLYVPAGYTNGDNYYSERLPAFWVSRYLISLGKEGQPISAEGRTPYIADSIYEVYDLVNRVGASPISLEEISRYAYYLHETSEDLEFSSDGNYQLKIEKPVWTRTLARRWGLERYYVYRGDEIRIVTPSYPNSCGILLVYKEGQIS